MVMNNGLIYSVSPIEYHVVTASGADRLNH